MKPLVWVGDSRRVVRGFPEAVQDDVGYGLYMAQLGEKHHAAKPMHGLGSGVMELVVAERSGSYRAVYTVAIGEAIYVVHAFQKKSKTGIATPGAELAVVRQRLKRLREELNDEERHA